MGGLVVKLACLFSIHIGPFGHFHYRLCGMSFLATPHHGSRDDWKKIFEPFHRDKRNDRELELEYGTMNSSIERFEKMPVVSLGETQPVRISGKKTLLVTEHNVRLDFPKNASIAWTPTTTTCPSTDHQTHRIISSCVMPLLACLWMPGQEPEQICSLEPTTPSIP
jgi:hypothetical protein